MPASRVDGVVIGAGIVGLATALAIRRARPGATLVVVDKERAVGAHQTGHNSGVIHAGVYYKPGSLKARTCAAGRAALEQFCAEHGVVFERCGKLIVATEPAEMPALDELEGRGRANGLHLIRRIGPEEMREREPHAAGVGALWVPETGIVDYAEVARAYASVLSERGVELKLGSAVTAIVREVGPEPGIVVTAGEHEIRARVLVACAGLASDRVARLAGLPIDVAILPFRGEYYLLAAERAHLVRHLIYPVPDPRFPFLGVHFTRRVHGGIEAGPNAVLAWAREDYARSSFDARDAWGIATWPGFWRMAGKHWRAGWAEQWRSWSRAAFARACARLVPAIRPEDLRPGGVGIRAQAVSRNGKLLDDFAIVHAERMVHVLNAPSPAATASLAIGEEIASQALPWI